MRIIDGVGSFVLDTPDGEIEALRWTHRDPSYGWDVRDNRGAGRSTNVRTKRDAQRLVKSWALLPPTDSHAFSSRAHS